MTQYLRTAVAIASLLGAAATACTPAAGTSSATVPPAVRGPVNQYGYPESLAPRPTSAAITAEDLMTRSYIFADDSMMGRWVGHVGNMKGNDYIARELRRMGVQPAGENGSYFQTLPYIQRRFTSRTTMTAAGTPLRFELDFVPVPGARAPQAIAGAPVVFGGDLGAGGQMIAPDQAVGKFVIVRGAMAAGGRAGGAGNPVTMFPGAVGVGIVDLDALSPAARTAINNPRATLVNPGTQARTTRGDIVVNRGGRVAVVRDGQLVGGSLPAGETVATIQQRADAAARADSVARAGRQGGGGAGRAGGAGGRAGGAPAVGAPPALVRLTASAAARLLGWPIADAALGLTGGSVTASFDFVEEPTAWGRNVVAVIPGSDPALRGQYVAVGSHNDHVGFNTSPVDHDSLRTYSLALLATRIRDGELFDPPAGAAERIRVNLDSLRRIRPARLDSINNGADDDGSGSMAMLEIAEAIQAMPVKPRRSILFVWHTGEEGGLTGSAWFANNPTVPLDSIVAQINLDMIGRGRAEDAPGGGPTHLGVLGSRRLSGEIGALVTSVNARQPAPFRFDDRYDDPAIGMPPADPSRPRTWTGYNNLYGRSDHANYARKCIPIVFFFTGLHGDYHRVTDEAQYLDYPHFAAVTRYVSDLTLAIAGLPQRPQLDQPCVRE